MTKPRYRDDWVSVYSVDALTGLQALPERSVHCAITSPPYWALRSYLPSDHPDKAMELGAEPTPELYVERLVEVFRALRRVLRDDGTLWLNLSDSFGKGKQLQGIPWRVAFGLQAGGLILRCDCIWSKPNPMPESVTDRPTKSHEYMFLLTKSPRYFFDQEAVREPHAPAGPTNPRARYGGVMPSELRGEGVNQPSNAIKGKSSGSANKHYNPAGRNIRSVWNIATRPYPGQHYSTFPPDLVYPCIKAGTSERGVCEKCLAPWERVVERTKYEPPTVEVGVRDVDSSRGDKTRKLNGKSKEWAESAVSRTVGWQPTCSCNGEYIKEPYEVSVVNRETGEPETFTRYRSVYVPAIPLSEHPVVPATVLDPFMGSGTTALAARKLGRRSIGFDLDERNMEQTEDRLGYQGVLL